MLALDARVRLAAPTRADRLAIRAYPRDLETTIRDAEGAVYAVRPVRPDDAGALSEFVSACAPDDIRLRFFAALRALPGQLAARLTQIDYRREMAFLALDADAIAGVARLAADPDDERAEFAALVRSDRKGRGLGTRLMTLLIDYARSQGIGVLFGHVMADNERMLALCAELGFTRRRDPEDGRLLIVELRLGRRASDEGVRTDNPR